MARRLIGGLIQAAAPITDPAAPIDRVRQASLDVHLPLIEEAGKRGVQILGLQEVFNGPYFCPSQDAHWYDIAESVPGFDLQKWLDSGAVGFLKAQEPLKLKMRVEAMAARTFLESPLSKDQQAVDEGTHVVITATLWATAENWNALILEPKYFSRRRACRDLQFDLPIEA